MKGTLGPLCSPQRQGQGLDLGGPPAHPGLGEGLQTQAAALLLCAFKEKFTLSGLLGKNRVNLGPSLPPLGCRALGDTLGTDGNRSVSVGLGLPTPKNSKRD